jgi:hypothetical protein
VRDQLEKVFRAGGWEEKRLGWFKASLEKRTEWGVSQGCAAPAGVLGLVLASKSRALGWHVCL